MFFFWAKLALEDHHKLLGHQLLMCFYPIKYYVLLTFTYLFICLFIFKQLNWGNQKTEIFAAFLHYQSIIFVFHQGWCALLILISFIFHEWNQFSFCHLHQQQHLAQSHQLFLSGLDRLFSNVNTPEKTSQIQPGGAKVFLSDFLAAKEFSFIPGFSVHADSCTIDLFHKWLPMSNSLVCI